MELAQNILLLVFVAAALIGYRIINKVPSLFHTPLMSGMNAFSGVTVLGCLSATAVACKSGNHTVSMVLGMIAIVLATINVAGGFRVTHRMLKMFHGNSKDGGR